jgi:predicted nucleotide-binding protein
MPRRTPTRPPTPQLRPSLTVEQKRRCIERFRQRIDDLEKFDPQAVQTRFNDPAVLTLETSIDEALSAAFGHETVEYNRYSSAKRLDHGPLSIGPLYISGHGRAPDYAAMQVRDARQYLTQGKAQSIALLNQAVRSLEEEIADQSDIEQASLPQPAASAPGDKVFLVHGRDDAVKNEVALFLRAIGLEPIILHLRPNGGRHLLTKFREESEGASFAIVLMTPDDEGGIAGAGANQPRARQNVVFELGFFIGKLGPANVAALLKADVEKPSDFDGIAYISFDAGGQWKTLLARELHHAKIPFDPAKAFTA